MNPKADPDHSEHTRRVICAPDSFKGSLGAAEVAAAMAKGIARSSRDWICDHCPVGDGGEGTLDALAAAMQLEIVTREVMDPLGRPIEARFGVTVDRSRAVVELAAASGLTLLAESERDPMRTTTYGTGQLIRAAIDAGCREVIVGIGGSATVDGGTGIAQALGARFFDEADREVNEPMCGGLLAQIARIDCSGLLLRPSTFNQSTPARHSALRTEHSVPIRVACDVTNSLLGEHGAAAVYGPQKGATTGMVQILDGGLANLARLCGAATELPGAGAAGGAGYGLIALCGGTLERGIDLVLDAVRFDDRCRSASLVLTGEGRLDEQSLNGKACMGVARAAAKLGVPTMAIVGQTGDGWQRCVGSPEDTLLADVISLSDRFGESRALSETSDLIALVTQEAIDSRHA